MPNSVENDPDTQDSYSERVLDIIIHDAKNLLTSINISSEVLTGETSSEVRRLAESIHTAGSKMQELFANYQKIIQIEQGRYECQLRDELIFVRLQSVAQELERDLARKKVEVVFTSRKTYEVLTTDWFCLEYAIRNLLSNALEASPVGDKIRLSYQKRFDGFYLDIQNNGVIPPGILAQLFNGTTSFSTKTNRRGLGTYIVRKMIDTLGGSVTVESTVEKGTLVRVKLP